MKAWVYRTGSVYRRATLPAASLYGFKHLDRALRVLRTGDWMPTREERCGVHVDSGALGLGHWAEPGEPFAVVALQYPRVGRGAPRLAAGVYAYTPADLNLLVGSGGVNLAWGGLIGLDYEDIYLPEEDFVTKVSLMQTLYLVADL